MHRPVVKKPEGERRGRGFSLRELREAGIPLSLAKRLGIAVDRRRKSLHEKNVEELKRIAAQKPAPEKRERKAERLIELEEIKGVGPKKAEQLKKAGIMSANDLLGADIESLAEKSGISVKVLKKLVTEAEKLVKRP